MSEVRRFLTVDDEIRQFRARRARLVRGGLEGLGLDHPVLRSEDLAGYAIANEVAAQLRDAAGAGGSQADLVTAAHQQLKTGAEALTPVGPVQAVRCAGLDEDQCMFSGGVEVEPPTAAEQELLGHALGVLARTGTTECVTDSVGVVAVLGLAEPGAATATWATGRLPYVVHLHLMPRAELVARDLIHEATHTYLNDWLAAHDVQLDPVEPLFWSPWKDTRRPLFGFTHSIVAFSVVTAFLAGVMAGDDRDWSWLRPFHEAERDRLRSCAESVSASVAMLPGSLGGRVSDVYALATD